MATDCDVRGGNQRGTPEAGITDAPVRVLFVASEIFPLAKTGGLADVCAALPLALDRLGVDLQLLMPGYPSALEQIAAPRVEAELGEVLPGVRARLIHGLIPGTGMPVRLVDCPSLYERPGSPYQDPDGHDWPDNALRYGLLCHVAARLALGQAHIDWKPEIVHCHDWHTGLVPMLLHLAGERRCRSVFTIHNAAFQGNYPLDTARRLGIPAHLMNSDGVEFFGQLSFLKAGVRFADKVTTVSPTYAREVQTPEFGCGLEGLYAARSADLVGIMNGIDAELWNPATDPHLAATYSEDDRVGKSECKMDLQRSLGFAAKPEAPVAIFVSRVTPQKMADVVLDHMPQIMARHPALQFALLGKGDRSLEEGFARLACQYPGRVAVRIGYTEKAAHQMHAGADLLLHGSRFEPCGLTQQYAMRYGTIPIVSRVGGLADSVVDHTSAGDNGVSPTGFVFDQPTGPQMESALERCLEVYEGRTGDWSALQGHAMKGDFGWMRSAQRYLEVYQGLLSRRPLATATAIRSSRRPLAAAGVGRIAQGRTQVAGAAAEVPADGVLLKACGT
jgi:starch synthase